MIVISSVVCSGDLTVASSRVLRRRRCRLIVTGQNNHTVRARRTTRRLWKIPTVRGAREEESAAGRRAGAYDLVCELLRARPEELRWAMVSDTPCSTSCVQQGLCLPLPGRRASGRVEKMAAGMEAANGHHSARHNFVFDIRSNIPITSCLSSFPQRMTSSTLNCDAAGGLVPSAGRLRRSRALQAVLLMEAPHRSCSVPCPHPMLFTVDYGKGLLTTALERRETVQTPAFARRSRRGVGRA